uniref:Uncharacterized protein n=1 Tax=Zea mays TaxID=4577 RepID=A0A804RGE9_MAIZE
MDDGHRHVLPPRLPRELPPRRGHRHGVLGDQLDQRHRARRHDAGEPDPALPLLPGARAPPPRRRAGRRRRAARRARPLHQGGVPRQDHRRAGRRRRRQARAPARAPLPLPRARRDGLRRRRRRRPGAAADGARGVHHRHARPLAAAAGLRQGEAGVHAGVQPRRGAGPVRPQEPHLPAAEPGVEPPGEDHAQGAAAVGGGAAGEQADGVHRRGGAAQGRQPGGHHQLAAGAGDHDPVGGDPGAVGRPVRAGARGRRGDLLRRRDGDAEPAHHHAGRQHGGGPAQPGGLRGRGRARAAGAGAVHGADERHHRHAQGREDPPTERRGGEPPQERQGGRRHVERDVPGDAAGQGAPAGRRDSGGERAPEPAGGGAGAEAAEEVRVQVVADPDSARRRRAAAHDGDADFLLRVPMYPMVRISVPDAAGRRNPVTQIGLRNSLLHRFCIC